MLELANETCWAAMLVSGWARDRSRQLTLVIKQGYRFELDGSVSPLERETLELEGVDRYHGDPLASSLAAACELVPFKAGGEFLLTGTAYPPTEQARVMRVEAGIRFSDGTAWQKRLHVFGERRWQRSWLGWRPSGPQPLEPLPLRYEYAFGGYDEVRDESDPRNPVGCGFTVRGRAQAGQRLPQIECESDPVRRPGDRPAPAGFGPLPVQWEPRSDLAAIDEEALALGLCPYREPVSAALHNAAPVDQRFPQPFKGDEVVVLKGFFKERHAAVEIALPTAIPQAFLIGPDRWHRLELCCDTISVDADARQLSLLWRGAIPWAEAKPRQGWVALRSAASTADRERIA